MNAFIETYPTSGLETGRDGFTSLHWAAVRGNFETLAYFLEHEGTPESEKQKLTSQTDYWGRTALHLAASHDKPEAIEKILKWANRHPIEKKLGAEADIKGRTALHLAAAWGRVKVIEALLSKHQRSLWDIVTIHDNYGCTALHIAVDKRQDMAVEKIVDNVRICFGNDKYWAYVALKIRETQDSNHEGETALDIAQRQHEKIEEELKELEDKNKGEPEDQGNDTDEGEQLEHRPTEDPDASDEKQFVATYGGAHPDKMNVKEDGDVNENPKTLEDEQIKARELDQKQKRLRKNRESIESIITFLFGGEESSTESAKRLLWAVKRECKTGFDVLTGKGVKDFAQDEGDGRTILHIEAEKGSIERYLFSSKLHLRQDPVSSYYGEALSIQSSQLTFCCFRHKISILHLGLDH